MKSLVDLLFCVRMLFKMSDCLFLSVDFLLLIFDLALVLTVYFIATLGVIFSDKLFLGTESAVGFLLVLGSFLFLIPPPLVDLGLGQSCVFRHLNDLFLAPVRLIFKFHFQNLQLSSALSLSFLQSILFFVILARLELQ